MSRCEKCGGKIYYLGCDTNVKWEDEFPIRWCKCKDDDETKHKINSDTTILTNPGKRRQAVWRLLIRI